MTTPDMTALRNEICARMGVNSDLVPVPRLCSIVTVQNTHAAPTETPLQGDMAAQVAYMMGVTLPQHQAPRTVNAPPAGLTADQAARIAHLMGVNLPQHQAQQVSPLAGQIQALTAQVQALVQQHQQQAATTTPNDQDATRAEVFRLMGVSPTQRTGA